MNNNEEELIRSVRDGKENENVLIVLIKDILKQRGLLIRKTSGFKRNDFEIFQAENENNFLTIEVESFIDNGSPASKKAKMFDNTFDICGARGMTVPYRKKPENFDAYIRYNPFKNPITYFCFPSCCLLDYFRDDVVLDNAYKSLKSVNFYFWQLPFSEDGFYKLTEFQKSIIFIDRPVDLLVDFFEKLLILKVEGVNLREGGSTTKIIERFGYGEK